jgi:sterol desaturase/sphingolipid hydroxylase (fatty acid hydroxylase superfamily)
VIWLILISCIYPEICSINQEIMKAQEIKQSNWVKLENLANEYRFGVIAITLLIIGCLGGITMNYGAALHTWSLVAVVIPTMTTLSLLLAVSPMKWILNAFIVTVITDLIVVLFV